MHEINKQTCKFYSNSQCSRRPNTDQRISGSNINIDVNETVELNCIILEGYNDAELPPYFHVNLGVWVQDCR